MITADGSEDELIQPESLPNYKVLPPSMLDPVSTPPVSLASADNEDIADDFEGDEEKIFS